MPGPSRLPRATSPPYRRHRLRRAAAGAALAGALAVAAAGCAKIDAALGKREEVVQFQPGTPTSVRLKVRAACSHVAQVTPEPLPTTNIASSQLYDVRYLVTNATDADLARLTKCLARFPSVAGLTPETPGGG